MKMKSKMLSWNGMETSPEVETRVSQWDRLGEKEAQMKRESHFPPGWDEERVRSVLEYYESQTEDEAVAEHEAAYEDPAHAMMAIPKELVPAVNALLAKHDSPQSTPTVS
jgi:hypothetical protein